MTTNIAIRIQSTGGAELKRELEDVGQSGKRAFDGVEAAADAAGAATDRLKKKSEDAAEAAKRVPGSVPAAPNGALSAPSAPGSAPSPATSREIERLRSQLDEEYRKTKQLGAAEDRIGRGVSGGYFDAAEADRLRGLAAAKYGSTNDNDPDRRGLSTYDKQFIKYQGFDVASSLGSGAGLTTVAFQQGPQVLQQLADREGGLKAGLGQLAESAKSLVTPFTVAGAAVVAAAGVFALASSQYARDQETLSRSLKTTGRSTDLSLSQLDTLASRTAEAGKVSTSTAREIAAGFASTGEIAGPVFDTLISKTSDYARIIGSDVPTATAELARMFADPAKGADDLGSKLGGLDDRTRQYIVTLAEQGDKTAAQTALAEALKTQIDANAAATTKWGNAWNFVSGTADKAWESIKRAVGASVTTPQSVLADLNLRVATAEKNGASPGFLDPLRAQRDAAKAEVDRAEAAERTRAATEKAIKASVEAGNLSRNFDPVLKQRADNQKNYTTLKEALDDPDARSRIADVEAAVRARDAYKRAVDSAVDANGKLITSEELLRRQDQLSLDATKAKTKDELAAIAQRRTELDLIGKAVTSDDAEARKTRAGILARAQEEAKGGGKSDTDKRDDFDSAERSIQNGIQRQEEQNRTYGLGAEEVARYRVQTELLTAAKRAEREVTPDLTARIEDYANQAAEAAKRNEELRESSKRTDEYRSIGSDGVRTFVRGLSEGVAQGRLLETVLSNLKNRVADLAANSIGDLLFGKRGSPDAGLLSGLLGGSSAANAPAAGAQGPTLQGGGMASLLTAAKSFLGFDAGGYTGPGGRFEPAGIVHRGEVVWSQDDVARTGGVAVVEAMRRGWRSYAAGGVVGSDRFTMPSAAASGAPSGGLRVIINEAPGGDQATARMGRGPDGDPAMFIDLISRQQAADISSGRGDLAALSPGARRLRG